MVERRSLASRAAGDGVGSRWSGKRRAGRGDRIRAAVAMLDRDRMDEAVFEAPLDRDGLGLGHESGVVALGTGFDERPAAVVLDDEFVAGGASGIFSGGDRESAGVSKAAFAAIQGCFD